MGPILTTEPPAEASGLPDGNPGPSLLSVPDTDFTFDLVPGRVDDAPGGVVDSTQWVDPDRLRVVPGLNVRLRTPAYLERVRRIADSIKADGFRQTRPLIVFVHRQDGEDRLYVQDGHTRFEALRLAREEGARIDRIPVLTMPPGTSLEDITADLVNANDVQPLSTYEKSIVAKRLSNAGLSNAEIGRRLGMTPTNVANLLILSGASSAMVSMIVEGKVSATMVIQAMRDNGVAALGVLMRAVAAREVESVPADRRGTPGRITRRVASTEVSPQAAYEQASRLWAPDLVTTLKLVQSDAAYGALDTATRGIVDGLVAQVDAMRREINERFAQAAQAARAAQDGAHEG